MGKSCVITPKHPKKAELFKKLNSNFGRKTAVFIYNKVTGSQFINDFKDSLTLSEGVPTYESIMGLKIVRDAIGNDVILNVLNSKQTHLSDTISNVKVLMNEATKFNNSNDGKNYVAYIDYDDSDNITLKIVERNKENESIYENQFKIQKLNEKIDELLSPLGITIGDLSNIEKAAGRVGVTNFNHAKDIANNFEGLIRVANNMEGAVAISEEFAHFIIGIYRSQPIVQRAIKYLSNEFNAREVLGDEYDKVSEFYDGDAELIAEEAAGHILKKSLLKRVTPKEPLFKRMLNYVLNLFKKINPGYYKDSIMKVENDFNNMASDILQGNKNITKKDVVLAHRVAEFNALSKKVDAQIKTLNKVVEFANKKALLQRNLDAEVEKSEQKLAFDYAKELETTVKKHVDKEESMAAIAAAVTLTQEDIKANTDKLENLDGLSTSDKSRVCNNVLTTIRGIKMLLYGDSSQDMDGLMAVTHNEFIQDAAIQEQSFMVEDASNALEDYETENDVEQVDTSNMSSEEIANRIVEDSKNLVLSDDETHYVDKTTGEKKMRTTKVIEADKEGKEFDPNSPYVTPSTNIGTGVDEFVRDVMAGRVKKVNGKYEIDGTTVEKIYPNATLDYLNKLAEDILKLKDREASKGITIIPRDVTIDGTIETVDDTGKIHKVNVAGTLDLLGYDNKGNWYIYDMKTHRGNIDEEKKAKWGRQLSLYKQMLEHKYGIKINSLSVIPIKVTYKTPKGVGNGTAEYTVSTEDKHELYNGVRNNQILMNGTPYKGAKPTLYDGGTIDIDEKELSIQYRKLSGDETGGYGNGAYNLVQAVNGLAREADKLEKLVLDVAMPLFIEFLKPFVGENIRIKDYDEKTGKYTGKTKVVSIKEVIKHADRDISLLQRFLSTASDNPDALIQMFEHAVSVTKRKKEMLVNEDLDRIQAFALKFEKLGIKKYDWMYEDDKKNYINRFYDKSAYTKELDAFNKSLDAKYGEHPAINSEEYNNKNRERIEWLKDHLIDTPTGSIPNYKKYPQYKSRYYKLTSTQRMFYDEFMKFKEEYDSLIGPDKTYLTNTIKIRKSAIERLGSSLKGKALKESINGIKANMMKSFDDDNNYKTAKGIRDFDGSEILRLPLLYINADDTSDLSTDAISTLMAYADMARNYSAMNSIVDSLELGKYLTLYGSTTKRDIALRKGGKLVQESFKVRGKEFVNPLGVKANESMYAKTLEDFFNCHVYNRYMKDAGEFKGVDVNKAGNFLLKLGSFCQLGFNALSGMANAATGIAMQNIEAVAGEHFNAKELASADLIFSKELPMYAYEMGSRVKTSKLSLFLRMFDVRQNASQNARHKNWLAKYTFQRVVGPGLSYMFQDVGDSWLYSRSALAVALRFKLKDKNGNKINLWEALEKVPIDKSNPDLGYTLKLKDGVTKLNGKEFSERDIIDTTNNIKYINHHCFGVYNEDDLITARQFIVGKFFMQYRDWIPAQFRYRFGARTTNMNKKVFNEKTGEWEASEVEGYYRTYGNFMWKLFKEIRQGEFNRKQIWNQLDDFQKKNIVRARAECLQWLSLCIIGAILRGMSDGDKDTTWAKYLRYLIAREKTELGVLIPPLMPKELINITKSPFAATSTLSDVYNLSTLLNPFAYTQTMKSGDYKDSSVAYKAFMQSPLTGPYKTIKRNLDPDKATTFFER